MKTLSTLLLGSLFIGTTYFTGIGNDVLNFFAKKQTPVQQKISRPFPPPPLFRTTGVDDVVTKALAFKASLTNSQQSTLELTYTASLARKWSNLPCGSSCRNGIEFSDLSSSQLALAQQVVEAALGASSNEGAAEFYQIRLADYVLGHTYSANGYDSTIYFMAFLNTPTTTGQWMLQFGGHHYAANIGFNSGKVVGPTPQFRGVEPSSFTVDGTTYAPLSQEQTALRNMLASFTTAELETSKNASTFSDCLMSPGESNGNTNSFPSTKQGIQASQLDASQQALVLTALEPYLTDLDDSTAGVLRTLYANSISDTYITWTGSGTSGDASSFLNTNTNYVRIDGPKVWVEFICQTGVVIRSQIHFHTVFRDHDSDYGSDLAASTLPLSLISFRAKLQGGSRMISWTTAAESSIHHYEVERNANGSGDYTSLGQVAVKNNSSNNYSFTDNSPVAEKMVYYRLKIIEANGSSRNSNVVPLKLNGKETFSIYPNPARSKISLTLSQPVANATISIFNAAGKLVYAKKNQAGGEMSIEIGSLPNGVYTVKVLEKDAQLSGNFIKQ